MSILEGVMIGSDCADFWEKRNKEYHEELEQYVLENPGMFGVLVATAKATAADFAMVMWVDLARLGEGAAQGGVKGIVQDLFRVLSFIPQGKVVQGHKTWIGQVWRSFSNFVVWKRVGDSLCVPIAIAQALQQTGHKIFVSIQDIATALRVPLDVLRKKGTSDSVVMPALTKLGLKFTQADMAVHNTFAATKQLAERLKRPILVTLEDHTVLIGQTAKGVKIIDRYGVFNNLDDLARYYNRPSFNIDPTGYMLVIENAVVNEALIALAKSSDVLAVLVRQSAAIFDIKVSKEEIEADFERFLQRKGVKRKHDLGDIHVSGGKSIVVVPGDLKSSTLSGISKAEYGEFNLWPLIYDLNRDVVGANPNRLKAGMKLLVLPLNVYTPQEIADARKRAPSWKNYL